MFLISLAEAIDRLVETQKAHISESERAVTVSALSVENASELIALNIHLKWSMEIFDRADEVWNLAEALDSDFAPYRLVIQKPAAPANTLQLLSNSSFAQWLERGHSAVYWHVARSSSALIVGMRVVQSWGEVVQEPVTLMTTKSPRALVKELDNVRCVPEDVRPWLATVTEEDFTQPTVQVWVRAASAALINCLPNEINTSSRELKFRGPPRLTLPRFDAEVESLGYATFNALQKALHWVFEHEREAEMRHILLATELAQSAASAERTSEFLSQHLLHSWESAQIAYQMALAETGKDTLKILSDLRKAITEETAKLSDMSRQLTGSVAVAVTTGIGLIAARVAGNASQVLVALVMFVVVLYVGMVIFSGVQFMRLQRLLRKDWHHRLYRFLPEAEYKRMVETPTNKAERSFVWTARIGGVAVAVLFLACIWAVLVPTDPKNTQSIVQNQPSTPLAPSSNIVKSTGSATPPKHTTATAAPAPANVPQNNASTTPSQPPPQTNNKAP